MTCKEQGQGRMCFFFFNEKFIVTRYSLPRMGGVAGDKDMEVDWGSVAKA